MEYLQAVFRAAVEILKLPLPIFGFNLSFWQVFMYTGVGSIVLGVLWEAFFGD